MRTRRRNRWRTPLAALLVGALVALAGCSGDETATPKRTLPVALPDLTLAGFDGGPELELGKLRGPAVLNLWASWCGPCRKELPILEEFSAEHAGRVQVLGVDFQDAKEDEARALIAETGVTYPLHTDFEGRIAEAPLPRVPGLPFLLFVDAEGQVVAWEAVIVKSVDHLEEMVAEHLDVELS